MKYERDYGEKNPHNIGIIMKEIVRRAILTSESHENLALFF